MLTHLEPQARKNGRSSKHCKIHNSCGVEQWSAAGAGLPSLLHTKETTYGKDTASGPLAGYTLAAPAPDPTPARPPPESGRQISMYLPGFLRRMIKNIVFYSASWPSAATTFA